MRVGILGGGLQGCCIALSLAERGVDVTLFDRNDQLLSRAAVANEGKIHLGYMYANDPGLSTARVMMQGALAFAPFFARHLGLSNDSMTISRPAAYVVHRDSQRTPDDVSQYLDSVHALIREASEGRGDAYFGRELSDGPRVWSAAQREAEFDPEVALAAFDTPEVAIDPVVLAAAVRDRLGAERRIDIRLRHEVLSVEDEGDLDVVARGPGGASRERFDHVVNALWDGRFAVNEKRGLRADRPWLHRLKYGVSFRLPPGVSLPPSATFVSGPFGEVVSYGDGLTYLTWYPVCLQGISNEVTPPPDWPTYPQEPQRSQLLEGTLNAMARFVPSLRALDPAKLKDVTVKGGVIVAWGQTDIYDPSSELHRRFEIGVTSTGRFHSVDPGKLTMAPYFADVCTDRILGDNRP
jgi:glycine/D-amino acid oxidase-like deaminating enzyme